MFSYVVMHVGLLECVFVCAIAFTCFLFYLPCFQRFTLNVLLYRIGADKMGTFLFFFGLPFLRNMFGSISFVFSFCLYVVRNLC